MAAWCVQNSKDVGVESRRGDPGDRIKARVGLFLLLEDLLLLIQGEKK